MTEPLEFIEKLVAPVHKTTFIWMHGLGDSGHGHEVFAQELSFPEEHGIKYIFPHAPSIPVTVNGGMTMPAWYDILEMNLGRKIDEAGLEKSASQISALIEKEVESGIDSKNIFLVGFSQGGAVALHTALKYPIPLGGIVCLSTYLGAQSVLETSTTHINKDIPIFWGHGQSDPVVPLSLTQDSIKTLEDHDYKVDFQTYPMDHSIHAQEVTDLQNWLLNKLS